MQTALDEKKTWIQTFSVHKASNIHTTFHKLCYKTYILTSYNPCNLSKDTFNKYSYAFYCKPFFCINCYKSDLTCTTLVTVWPQEPYFCWLNMQCIEHCKKKERKKIPNVIIWTSIKIHLKNQSICFAFREILTEFYQVFGVFQWGKKNNLAFPFKLHFFKGWLYLYFSYSQKKIFFCLFYAKTTLWALQ